MRLHLRRRLEAHLTALGYTAARPLHRVGTPQAEIARVSPVRGRLVYGATVLRADLRSRRCHDRLRFFANRRTRRRSQILFFVAVDDACRVQLESLLVALGIRDAVRGGNVHVLAVPRPDDPTTTEPPARGRQQTSPYTAARRGSTSGHR